MFNLNLYRTYDEYRNPLMDALLEIDNEPIQNDQMIINYKRSLSPIMEESEDDITCRTFAINETRILDNNSTRLDFSFKVYV